MATPNLLNVTTVKPVTQTGQQVPNSETTLYTVGSGKATKLTTAVLTNTTGSAVTISFSIVRTGNSAAATNRLISSYSLTANNSLSLAEYLSGGWLNEGDFLSAIAGSNSAITFTMTGLELS